MNTDMEDDKLKKLFSDFEPDISSDFQFMTKLQRNMNAVEIVRQHTSAQRKRSRTAVLIAAVSGFISGVILTLLFSLIEDWITTIQISITHLSISPISIDSRLIAYIVMAAVSVITALNAYEIAMARLSLRKTAV